MPRSIQYIKISNYLSVIWLGSLFAYGAFSAYLKRMPPGEFLKHLDGFLVLILVVAVFYAVPLYFMYRMNRSLSGRTREVWGLQVMLSFIFLVVGFPVGTILNAIELYFLLYNAGTKAVFASNMSAENQRFGFSRGNLIYALLAIGAIIFLIYPRGPVTDRQMGEIAGTGCFFFAIPWFIAWLGWRISGRSRRPAYILFNVVLTLLFLGQLGTILRKSHIYRIEVKAVDQLFADLAVVGDTEDEAVIEERIEAMVRNFKKTSENLSGEPALAYRMLAEFIGEYMPQQLALVKARNHGTVAKFRMN